jgi:hypothetical protein
MLLEEPSTGRVSPMAREQELTVRRTFAVQSSKKKENLAFLVAFYEDDFLSSLWFDIGNPTLFVLHII